MFKWNPAFNFVMNIKKSYIELFGEPVEYNLEQWIERLDYEPYNVFAGNVKFTHFDNKVLVRYDITCREMYESVDSVYRECRSIVIDLRDDEIVLLPFRKFFNLNEVPENNMDIVEQEIKNAKDVEFSVKLDGSMQSFRWYKGKIFSSGSQALNSENSWRLQDGIAFLTDSHQAMLMENPDYTFIFEYISEANVNVVSYAKNMEGLHLIGARNVYDGKQLSYKALQGIADEYGIRAVDIEVVTLEDVMKMIDEKRADEFEGWVLNIDSHMVKIKCNDYVKIHRVLSAISSVNVIIESIANENFDDIYSKVPEGHKPRVLGVAEQIFSYVKNMNQEIDEMYNKAPMDDKKTFMIWVDANCRQEIRGYIRSKYLGKEYNVLKGGAGQIRKASEIGVQSKLNLLDESN